MMKKQKGTMSKNEAGRVGEHQRGGKEKKVRESKLR